MGASAMGRGLPVRRGMVGRTGPGISRGFLPLSTFRRVKTRAPAVTRRSLSAANDLNSPLTVALRIGKVPLHFTEPEVSEAKALAAIVGHLVENLWLNLLAIF